MVISSFLQMQPSMRRWFPVELGNGYQDNFNGHFKLSSDATVNETVVPC